MEIRNPKANRDYEILETYEAGIVLEGAEVKSVRLGRVSLKEAYCKVIDGEVFVINMHIAPYEHAREVSAPKRRRKLLLKKREIKRLIGKIQEKGLTLIPISIYFNERGWAKLKIGVARGRRKHEKKEVLKQRDIEREVERELKRW